MPYECDPSTRLFRFSIQLGMLLAELLHVPTHREGESSGVCFYVRESPSHARQW